MTVRIVDTGRLDRGEPIFQVLESEDTAVVEASAARLQVLEDREGAILAVVQAVKDLQTAHPEADVTRMALSEVAQCQNLDASTEAVRRAVARKAVFTDALAAVAALP